VPSLFHKFNVPCASEKATKKMSVFNRVIVLGNPNSVPGTKSFTITVPAAVPSLFHNSYPCSSS
jgi:hypothetical protein